MAYHVSTFTFLSDWEAICQEGQCINGTPPGGTLSTNPKFGWARKHVAETGHNVLIRRTQEWSLKCPDSTGR